MFIYQRVRIDWSDFWGRHPKNAPFHTLPGKTHQLTGPLSTVGRKKYGTIAKQHPQQWESKGGQISGVSHTQAPASPVPGASETPSQMNTEKLEGQLINRAYRAYPMCNTKFHWEYHHQPIKKFLVHCAHCLDKPKVACIKESSLQDVILLEGSHTSRSSRVQIQA